MSTDTQHTAPQLIVANCQLLSHSRTYCLADVVWCARCCCVSPLPLGARVWCGLVWSGLFWSGVVLCWLSVLVMDVRSLTFPSSSFGCVLDKGTLDAILCGLDSSKHAHSMLAECQRVLRPGGCLLVITYGQPSSRLTYLEQRVYDWDVTYETLGGTRYMYRCVKRHTADGNNSSGSGADNGETHSSATNNSSTDEHMEGPNGTS